MSGGGCVHVCLKTGNDDMPAVYCVRLKCAFILGKKFEPQNGGLSGDRGVYGSPRIARNKHETHKKNTPKLFNIMHKIS
jgi:hypothetical protein